MMITSKYNPGFAKASRTQAVVEVFKTNVDNEYSAKLIIQKLKKILPQAAINFDLEDCDRVLRIAFYHGAIEVQTITGVVEELGFSIEPF
jgi:hypothetical protein